MTNELAELLREASHELVRPRSQYARHLHDRLESAAASLEAQEPVAWQLVDQPAHIEVEYQEYHRGSEWEPLYRRLPPTSAVMEAQEPAAFDDAVRYGTGFHQNGQRVDLRDVYLHPPTSAVQCVACEGKPSTSNNPCFLCGEIASAVPAKDAFDLGFRFGRITASEHYEGPPLRCPDGEHYMARRKEILDKAAQQQGGGDDE